MDNTNLKTCPYCGGKASLYTLDEGNGINYVVVCETDGCRASEDYAWSYQDDKMKAISAWNKRA
jgi:Lar family restriction alleviation protein